MIWLLVLAPLALLGWALNDSDDGDSGGGGSVGQEGSETDQVLKGGNGSDAINAAGGDDLIEAAAGNDTVQAGEGNDVVFAQGGDDTVDGGAGSDFILGMWGDDALSGGAGDDVLQGGRGADLLDGGAGDDLLLGINFVNSFEFLDELNGVPWQGDNTQVQVPFNTAKFTEQPDTISGADTLKGGAGDDLMLVGPGDSADGGAGADELVLGPWNGTQNGAPMTLPPAELTLDDEDIVVVNFGDGPDLPTDIRTAANGDQELVVDGEVYAVINGTGQPLTKDNLFFSSRVNAFA